MNYPIYAEPLSILDRTCNFFFNPLSGYKWSQPISDPNRAYPPGFNAHEVCLVTGVERFYNAQTFVAGPMYRYRPQRPFLDLVNRPNRIGAKGNPCLTRKL